MKINVFQSAITLQDEEDEGLAGIYQVTFDTDVIEIPEIKLASAALFHFHEEFGMSTLEDFDISVITDDNQRIEEACHHTASLRDPFCQFEKIDDVALDLFADDADLSAEELDEKYNTNGDGEHPKITRKIWREAVAREDTISGYWLWVAHTLITELEERSHDAVTVVSLSVS